MSDVISHKHSFPATDLPHSSAPVPWDPQVGHGFHSSFHYPRDPVFLGKIAKKC